MLIEQVGGNPQTDHAECAIEEVGRQIGGRKMERKSSGNQEGPPPDRQQKDTPGIQARNRDGQEKVRQPRDETEFKLKVPKEDESRQDDEGDSRGGTGGWSFPKHSFREGGAMRLE